MESQKLCIKHCFLSLHVIFLVRRLTHSTRLVLLPFLRLLCVCLCALTKFQWKGKKEFLLFLEWRMEQREREMQLNRIKRNEYGKYNSRDDDHHHHPDRVMYNVAKAY